MIPPYCLLHNLAMKPRFDILLGGQDVIVLKYMGEVEKLLAFLYLTCLFLTKKKKGSKTSF